MMLLVQDHTLGNTVLSNDQMREGATLADTTREDLPEEVTLTWNLKDKEEPDRQRSVVQSLSCVPLFVTPWTAACQASLSFTMSWSLFKFMSIELVMPSNHLIFCCPLLLLPSIFPSIRVSSNDLALRGQSIGASVSASVLPVNIQVNFLQD